MRVSNQKVIGSLTISFRFTREDLKVSSFHFLSRKATKKQQKKEIKQKKLPTHKVADRAK